jgi:hypothetical protein
MQLSKSTSLTLMDVGPHKTWRKILSLRKQKTEVEPSTPEKSTITREAVIQVGDEAEGESKIDRYTMCIMKEIQITGQGIAK